MKNARILPVAFVCIHGHTRHGVELCVSMCVTLTLYLEEKKGIFITQNTQCSECQYVLPTATKEKKALFLIKMLCSDGWGRLEKDGPLSFLEEKLERANGGIRPKTQEEFSLFLFPPVRSAMLSNVCAPMSSSRNGFSP